MDTKKLIVIEGTACIGDPTNTVKTWSGEIPVTLAKAVHASRTAKRSEARDFAAELVKRWNAFHELVSRLDNILCGLEDAGATTPADIKEARACLERLGYNDSNLGKLANHHEKAGY